VGRRDYVYGTFSRYAAYKQRARAIAKVITTPANGWIVSKSMLAEAFASHRIINRFAAAQNVRSRSLPRPLLGLVREETWP